MHARQPFGVTISVRVWFVLIFITLAAWADSPAQLYKRAKKAEKKGDILRAFTLYTQASFLDPKNPDAGVE